MGVSGWVRQCLYPLAVTFATHSRQVELTCAPPQLGLRLQSATWCGGLLSQYRLAPNFTFLQVAARKFPSAFFPFFLLYNKKPPIDGAFGSTSARFNARLGGQSAIR